MGPSARHLSRNFVYQHHTILALCSFVLAVCDGMPGLVPETAAERQLRMERAVSHLQTTASPVCERVGVDNARSDFAKGDVLLITGTTGALGSNMLAKLLASDEIGHVYALNRKRKDGTTQSQSLVHGLLSRGLDPSLASSHKLSLLEADFKHATLGLSASNLERVR